jgi:hypothetical protein
MSYEEQPAGRGPYSNCLYTHAEYHVAENYRLMNGIRNLDHWALLMGVVIYSSCIPCEDCMKYASWAGITLQWSGLEGTDGSAER